MPRLLVILLISWAYAGCAGIDHTPSTRIDPDLDPRRIRWNVAFDDVASAIGQSATARPLVQLDRPGPAPFVSRDDEHDGCIRIDFSGNPRFANGSTATPADLAVRWNSGRRDDGSDLEWLLEFVPDVDGIRATDDDLEICTLGSTTDLRERLRHPALWFWRPAEPGGDPEGPGPFGPSGENRWTPNPHYRPTANPEALERVRGEDPALLFRLDETDLAIAWGRDAGRLIAADETRIHVRRIPDWDRTYTLWLDPRVRWINDPRFRRWIAGAIDRSAMLDYLFDGFGEEAAHVVSVGIASSADELLDRPLSRSSEPRIALSYDVTDPNADRIASRIRARMSSDRVRIELRPLQPDALAAAVRNGRVEMAVLSHTPVLSDPVLAMREVVAALGSGAEPALTILAQSSGLESEMDRRRSAEAAEGVLVEQALLIPLIRLHAYLAVDRRLSGVQVGAVGILDFERAGWVR